MQYVTNVSSTKRPFSLDICVTFYFGFYSAAVVASRIAVILVGYRTESLHYV